VQCSAGTTPARNRHGDRDHPNANRHDDEVWRQTKNGPMNVVNGGRGASDVVVARDGNSGTGTRPNGAGYGNDFLPAGGTRTVPEPRRVQGRYFFPPAGNLMGTQYFTTGMILGCE
jgi:hypothetical protein